MRAVLSELGRVTTALLVGAVVPLASALLLIPTGPVAAWVGLLATAAAVGLVAGRDPGIAAGVTAGLVFMWVHGPERFSATVRDPWVIRFGFLLVAVGVAAALLADLWHRHRQHRHRHQERHRHTRPARAVVRRGPGGYGGVKNRPGGVEPRIRGVRPAQIGRRPGS